jgi:transcription elongation factor GreA
MSRRREQKYHSELAGQGPQLMTQQTKCRLEAKLADLSARIGEKSLSLGDTQESAQDWHDNAAYDQLQQDLDVLESQRIRVAVALDHPEIIEPRTDTSTVGLGNRVSVLFQGENQAEEFTILGPLDSETNESWISFKTPLAEALMGEDIGSEVSLPGGATVQLINIMPGDF